MMASDAEPSIYAQLDGLKKISMRNNSKVIFWLTGAKSKTWHTRRRISGFYRKRAVGLLDRRADQVMKVLSAAWQWPGTYEDNLMSDRCR
jgi:hypothetical protein